MEERKDGIYNLEIQLSQVHYDGLTSDERSMPWLLLGCTPSLTRTITI